MSGRSGQAARAEFDRRWLDTYFDDTDAQQAVRDRKELHIGCDYAQAFSRWCDRTLAPAHEHPTADMLPQAFQLLLHEFMIRVRALPRTHARKPPFRGHLCVFEVFLWEYEFLKDIDDANILSGFARPVAPQRPTTRDFFERSS